MRPHEARRGGGAGERESRGAGERVCSWRDFAVPRDELVGAGARERKSRGAGERVCSWRDFAVPRDEPVGAGAGLIPLARIAGPV